MRRLGRSREAGLLVAIVAVIAVIALAGDPQAFFGRANQINMLRQIGLLGVFAVGEAVVIIAGGIDLSVGSLIAFSGMACALVLSRLAEGVPYGQPAPAAALL
ncbi:MAG: ABC transporter permease, partial [Armatimonadetes bacterium]|nr:ABC transporter permease [Armatimonadota bacterium]